MNEQPGCYVLFDGRIKPLAETVHRAKLGLPNLSFIMHESGLHYYDPKSQGELCFVTTVADNELDFSKRELKGAQAARELVPILAYPSTANLKQMLRTGQIRNTSVTIRDVEVAEKVY